MQQTTTFLDAHYVFYHVAQSNVFLHAFFIHVATCAYRNARTRVLQEDRNVKFKTHPFGDHMNHNLPIGAIDAKYWPNLFEHCVVLVYQMRHEVMWFPWLIDSFLNQSASSRVIETLQWPDHVQTFCKNVLMKQNSIILWLNTIIPIVLMVWLSKMIWCLHRWIISFCRSLLFE